MKYAAYERYKPSKIEWVGDVPSHWRIARSDGIISSERRQVQPEAFLSEDVFHYSIPVVQEYGTGTVEDGESIKSAKQPILRKSLLVSKLNPRKATITVAEPYRNLRTLCSTEFVTLFADKCDLEFLTYVTLSEAFRQRLDAAVQSVTRSHQRANPRDIYSFWNAWPPLDEQQTIARFLDAKTTQIDALVAQKRQLIAKLKEKRSALIARTVTRGLPPEAAKAAGLEPNPQMKDSGVDWLGAVPVHWDVVRVKFVAKVESGHTPSRSEPSYWIEEECVIPWVSLNDSKFLKENDFISETAVKISEEGMRNSSAHLLPAGAVVFTRDATIGLTAITTVPAAVSQHVIAWLPGERVFAKYLLLVFKVMQNYLDSLTFGSTLKTIGMSDIRRIAMPIPSMEEQQAIAKYLDFEVSQIDGMTDKIELAIARLTEYRQALITSAVTGKIDVRRFDQRTES